MRSYSLIAPAKINLYLEILGDRPDGFHELVMVMQSIDLADQVDIRANGTNDNRVFCDHPQVPNDPSNLAYRAAELMRQQFPAAFARYGGVDITIHKHIPIGAGLAGGSTNAAAVLVGLDLLWELGLTQSEIQELGATLGSDIPFCVMGGTALATGRGEELAALPDLENIYVVLAKYRSLSVSTPWAYKTYRQKFGESYLKEPHDLQQRLQQVHSGPMIAAIAHRDSVEIGRLLYNDLEKVVLPAHPNVAALRDTFQQFQPLGAMMSGSGPTVFALLNSREQANQMKQAVASKTTDPDLDLWVAEFRPCGIQVAK
ncbi:MAG: 4-(cytidine 5'-diphospho)-2-C-methyl-D-erythritol kinase [Oscillatoriales cyanobacterium C42_A2020_001]|nr:4-(cytidine 5'-diphospho)-2-C-methyl-D-erythritol kinase [Leptolyngbyaceae cyanobacterium C42_A2020_001]